ncbi:MAG TPA: VWA domain-containing protein [Pyrinomonadaceae bacterium]
MRILAAVLMLTVTVTSALPRAWQDPQDPSQEDEPVVVGTSEVLMDAVVKDKKGALLKDLQASDFEVFEDGVKQEIRSFRLVTRGRRAADRPAEKAAGVPAPSPSPAPGARKARTTPPLSAVALVFDRLSPEARVRARDAALGYVGAETRPDDFVGVFSVDLSLRALQRFTSDGNLVRQAIERFASAGSSTHGQTAEQLGSTAQQLAGNPGQTGAGGAGLAGLGQETGGGTGSMGAAAADQQFAEMTRRAVEGFEILERGQQGYATTDALLSVINAMSRLPRRKALIFFSEGVAIPTAVQAQFRSVISAANRANVSIYTVDAAGLRAQSANAEAARQLSALGARRIATAGSPYDGNGPMSRDLERNEDLMNLNPEGGLSELASGTGGLFISSTNNPGARLRQVDEDLNTYYLLSYSPRNQDFNGQFRQINLKVNRPGVEVQARRGYYALDASYDTPVLHYEAPALALLGSRRTPPPDAFDSRVAAFNFPAQGNAGLVPVMVEVPAGSINFVVNKEKKQYATNFAVVVLVRDAEGRVVRKLSNQYILGGPLDKLDAARRGKILFYRETQLDPGRYAVSSIVHDATNGRASAREGALEVPAADDARLRLSSVVLIKSAEQTPPGRHTPTPFNFGELLLYPNMGEPVRKAAGKNLAFFVTAYPARGAAAAAKLKIEIAQRGRTLGQSSNDLPPPDADGRIQYASAVPIDKYAPGDYELKVTVSDARDAVTRTEKFTIAP